MSFVQREEPVICRIYHSAVALRKPYRSTGHARWFVFLPSFYCYLFIQNVVLNMYTFGFKSTYVCNCSHYNYSILELDHLFS